MGHPAPPGDGTSPYETPEARGTSTIGASDRRGTVVALRGVVSKPKNRILQALPDEDFRRIEQHLDPVQMRLREPLLEAYKPIDHVYFVESGVVSLITDVEPDTAIEVATIGNEGFVGTPIMLGVDVAPFPRSWARRSSSRSTS
jgi:hypothetical protein